MNKMAMIRRLSTRHPNFGLLNFRFGLGICQWTLFFGSSLISARVSAESDYLCSFLPFTCSIQTKSMERKIG